MGDNDFYLKSLYVTSKQPGNK